MDNKRQFITAILLLALALICVAYIHSGRGKDLSVQQSSLSAIPLEFDAWKGRDIRMDDYVYDILGTRDVLVRDYVNPAGQSIGLSIVRSSDDRSAFHPPEICYIGEGVELSDRDVTTFDLGEGFSIKANKLVMKDSRGFQVAWYWFTAGDNITHNYYLQQLQKFLFSFQV